MTLHGESTAKDIVLEELLTMQKKITVEYEA